MKIRKFLFAAFSKILILTEALSSQTARSQTPINGPATLPPSYATVPTYPAPVPSVSIGACANSQTWSSCTSSATLELQLETKFWALIQNADWAQMNTWIWDVENYINGSRTAQAGRLTMLQAFGQVMYQQGQPLGFANIPALLTAKSLGDKAVSRLPNSPNVLALQQYLQAAIYYATFMEPAGNSVLNNLDTSTDIFGIYGSEPNVVTAFGFMGSTNHSQVDVGISMLNDCTTADCLRTSSLAPFKKVGALIALAEGHVYNGNPTKANQLLDEAKTWATARNYPQEFLNRIENVRTTLMGPGGLGDQWQWTPPVGFIRMPMAPSMQATACATCHIGAVVPSTQYSTLTPPAGYVAPSGRFVEAELSVLSAGTQLANHASASGGTYVSYLDTIGRSVTITNGSAAKSLEIRYATPNNGSFSLYINGVKVRNFPIASTGGWTTFKPLLIENLSIAQGASVKFQFDSGNTAINLDYVYYNAPDYGTFVEAESGTRSAGPQIQANTYASGGNVVAYLDGIGRSLTFSSVAESEGISVRYAALSAGTFSLYINGVKSTFNVPATGSWTSYKPLSIKATIPSGATIKFQFDSGNTPINLDYLYLFDPAKPSEIMLQGEAGNKAGNAQSQGATAASDGAMASYLDAAGNGIIFDKVASSTAIELRYAAVSNGTFSLYVNGVKTNNFAVTATGGWTTFSTIIIPVTISNGSNIKFQFDAGNVPINIDFINLRPAL